MLRLRLFHSADGARIAYREGGTGPPLVLWHSRGLSHREFVPAAREFQDRARLVLPDLPLHGDSEESPDYSYELDWVARLVAEFTHDVGGAAPWVGGSGLGAQLVMRAVAQGWLSPGRLLLLPSALHRPAPAGVRGSAARGLARAIAPAGPLGARSVTRAMVRAELVGSGARPQLRTLAAAARTAMLESDERSNAWRRVLATWQTEEFRELIDGYRAVPCPTLLLCCSDEVVVPPRAAQEAADLIDDALLRTLPGTGPLLAYDDPVGFAREVAAFLRAPS